MSLPSSVCKWLRLPSRLALLLGAGALSTAGGGADTAQAHLGNDPGRVPQQSAKSFGELRIWSEAGRIYLSEAGGQAGELQLGDTPEARHLRQLLEREGATGDAPRRLIDRMILVGGGGNGISWAPVGKAGNPQPPGASSPRSVQPRIPARTAPPENAGVPGKATTTTRTGEKG
jgi:hypothetical protein